MNGDRIRALLRKELLDLGRNPTALVPVAIITVFSLVLPFVIAVVVPALTGRGLGQDAGFSRISGAANPPAALSADARVQFFLFEQFLVLFLLTPITGALVLAAHAVVGEKQARALEPLLATPITTLELLAAKLFGAAIPTFAISFAGLALYGGGILAFGLPGVALAMVNARSLLLTLWLAPSAALVSLQFAVLISSRVNDPRTAQQWGVLIIAPLSGLFIAQLTGSLWPSARALATIGAGLLAVWLLLLLFSVAFFERETILTRWR
jgi:ABC-2 type transport system permease protein